MRRLLWVIKTARSNSPSLQTTKRWRPPPARRDRLWVSGQSRRSQNTIDDAHNCPDAHALTLDPFSRFPTLAPSELYVALVCGDPCASSRSLFVSRWTPTRNRTQAHGDRQESTACFGQRRQCSLVGVVGSSTWPVGRRNRFHPSHTRSNLY